ncbi:hypothetical protein ONZ45_g15281 [Pleurotus djamor]|nr:hypothetical protein ONZ45_g15281 [Pleurotus djamor]
MESRIDLLVQLGYSVLAFNQVVHKKIDPKTHINVLDPLLRQLKTRQGLIYLKRLTIILDEDSEKGFGLINANTPLFNPYDIISLLPTTFNAFSLACLTHSLPSALTAHIITIPLTLPRLPFRMKHTLVRTALKNGAVFEIPYVGALGGENDAALINADAAMNDASAKRNWWASAKELCRVTKGKGLIVSSGAISEADLRAPRDIGNIITLLDVPQNLARDSMTTTTKSLVKRATTRKTYRAVLSEPRIVIPDGYEQKEADGGAPSTEAPTQDSIVSTTAVAPTSQSQAPITDDKATPTPSNGASSMTQKRPREEPAKVGPVEGQSKKKRKKNKDGRPGGAPGP